MSQLTIEELAVCTEQIAQKMPHLVKPWVYLLLVSEKARRTSGAHTTPADDILAQVSSHSSAAKVVVEDFQTMVNSIHDPFQYLEHWIDGTKQDLKVLDELVGTGDGAIEERTAMLVCMARGLLNAVVVYKDSYAETLKEHAEP